ncbi:MAG: hypothetical protein CMP67_02490 [Flavobacteriales bacterium]|nr:hypothetical protein [Flavobacteriales bacterium]
MCTSIFSASKGSEQDKKVKETVKNKNKNLSINQLFENSSVYLNKQRHFEQQLKEKTQLIYE